MVLALGIHNGHHASCALVQDGELVSGLEQERVTRRKADGQPGLSNALPIQQCLEIAGVRLDQVDVIVSSFQAIGPGGSGLGQPLVAADFSHFDVHDLRHFVISHHQAHAMSALAMSGFDDAAVLVCDLGGSATQDGLDFFEPFRDFERRVRSPVTAKCQTETLSTYNARARQLRLLHREFAQPHNAPDVFVGGPASLYDNVSRFVFRRENAHGELMALASIGEDPPQATTFAPDDLLEPSGHLRNDWQWRVPTDRPLLEYVNLAKATQAAFQRCLVGAARRAAQLTGQNRLCAAGGAFLNISTNAAILAAGLFADVRIPSSPHDAGIAIGAAFAGWNRLAKSEVRQARWQNDRVGPAATPAELTDALHEHSALVDAAPCAPQDAARLLEKGAILARFTGRAEFGPRALGSRSLLASPLLVSSKDRLNDIKGRQAWRPVAPVVPEEQAMRFFEGPAQNPYMNVSYRIREPFVTRLAALKHPDASARVQTLHRAEDPGLYAMLHEFGRLTGLPILVNTSLNGRGEPILHRPSDALAFLLRHEGVDGLLLGDQLVTRRANPFPLRLSLALDAVATTSEARHESKAFLVRGRRILEVNPATLDALGAGRMLDPSPGTVEFEQLLRAARLQILVPTP